MRRVVLAALLVGCWACGGATNVPTIYELLPSVLKTNSGMAQPHYYEFTQYTAGHARDTDYPGVGIVEAIKIVNSGGRNVFTVDTSGGETSVDAGFMVDQGLGHDAASTYYPDWLNADRRLIFSADYKLTTAAWDELSYDPLFTVGIGNTGGGAGPLYVALGFSDATHAYIDFKANGWGGDNAADSSYLLDRTTWENKRVRFKADWTPGVMDAGATTVTSVGSVTLSIIDLDTNIATTIYTFTGKPLYLSYNGQSFTGPTGSPDTVPTNNYISSFSLGFFGFMGEAERFAIDTVASTPTPVVPAPGSQIDNSSPCCDAGTTGSATGPVEQPVSSFWYPACTGGGAVPTASDVAESEDWAVEVPPKQPDCWLRILGQTTSPTEADECWGTKPLSDRGRFVAGRLQEIGAIERRSSDKDGHYAPARIRVVANDDDGTFRARLADPDRRDLIHREARVELLSYAGRKAGLNPLIRLQGRIVDVQPGLDRTAIIEIQDIVGSQFGPLDPEKTIGVPVGAEHPALPDASKGRIYPILLGEKSDAGLIDATGAAASIGMMPVVDCGDVLLDNPDPDGRAFNGSLARVDDKAGVNLSGTGGTITFPTRVLVSAIIGGEIGPPSIFATGFMDDQGDGMGGPSTPHAHREVWMDVTADNYIAWLTTVPGFEPFTNPTIDPNARYKIISGTPSNPAYPPRNGGVGPQWDFFVDFLNADDGDQWGVQSAGPPENLVATVDAATGSTRWVYALSSITRLGESRPCAAVVVDNGPAMLTSTDSITLTADLPVDNPDSVEYIRVLGRRTDPPTTYLAIIPTGGSPGSPVSPGSPAFTWTDDGTLAEQVFGSSSGNALASQDLWGWIACGLGEIDIHEVYGSDAAEGDTPKRRLIGWDEGTILGPTSTGWPHADPYRVVGGIRQSGFYARGLPLKHHRDGVVTFAWNGCGWKDTDGLLVNQAFRMLLLFLNEVVEKNDGEGYRDGDFGPIETFADGTPKFWTSKFEAAQQQTIDWLTPGSPAGLGYIGTIVVTEPTALAEILRRFFNDYGGHGTTNARGQWYPFLINPDPVAGAGRLYAERREIARLVDHRFAHDERENRIVYSYNYNFDTGQFRNQNITVEDTASIAAHGGDRIGVFSVGLKECFYANDPTTITDRHQRQLDLYAYAPRYVQWSTNMKAVPDHNGDPARFAHRKEGLGANGESGTPGVILHTSESLQPYEVIQTAMLFRTTGSP